MHGTCYAYLTPPNTLFVGLTSPHLLLSGQTPLHLLAERAVRAHQQSTAVVAEGEVSKLSK